MRNCAAEDDFFRGFAASLVLEGVNFINFMGDECYFRFGRVVRALNQDIHNQLPIFFTPSPLPQTIAI